jgi:hypothetical protein
MPANSQEIVQQVRQEFEALLRFVVDASPQTVPDADTMERGLLRGLLDLGCLLLQLYFVQQNQQITPETLPTQEGAPLTLHSHKARVYLSVFGQVRFARRYYYRRGQGNAPLDAVLNLPACGASDLLREWQEKLGVCLPYQQATATLRDLLGLSVSTRQVQQAVLEDAPAMTAYYAQAQSPVPDPEATLLVVQADGKGVPMRQNTDAAKKVRKNKGEKSSRKKEAIVTSIYTLIPTPRSAQEVVARLFFGEPTGGKRPAPHNKRLFATLCGKEAALGFTATQVFQQQGAHIRHRIALSDGSEALQQRIQAQFPDFRLVLDCIHAIEYLWKAANALLGETAVERTQWVQTRTLRMLSGQVPALITDLQEMAAVPDCPKETAKTLLSVAAYYARNRAFMDYDQYLALGWPIATGVIEGACRHLVKDRCELSGMRWTQPGAEALLQLRCVHENGDWEAFHAFRRDQRRQRLYGQSAAPMPHIELRMAA